MWYTFGIAWNPKLTARAYPGRAVDSLTSLFDPDVARRYKSCGIGVEDSGSDFVPIAAMAGGVKDWDSKTSIAAASKVLNRVAGMVRVVPTDQFVDELASGKLCVALGYSGDAVQAQTKAHGGIEYQIPAEGGLLSIDAMAIPANARNKKFAHVFLDYLLRPQVVAKISNAVGYANANLKAVEFMNESIKSNPAVIPSSAALSRTLPIPILTDRDRQEIEKIWTDFKR
jgi:spermidine/putrescine-binding protein